MSWFFTIPKQMCPTGKALSDKNVEKKDKAWKRAKRIGARLKLWGEPGAGTEAELTVPARIAYGKVHRWQGLWLFRKSKVES